MKKYRFLLICLVLAALGCSGSPKPDAGPEAGSAGPEADMYARQELGDFIKDTGPERTTNDYVIGVGDRLDVVFFFHNDLTTLDLLVRPDGRITLPYVGDVMAAGATPMHLDSTLTTRFEEILREPNLSIIVRSTMLPRIYVLGEVDRPGEYTFPVDMSVLQAVSHAGGQTTGAKLENTIVIRREGTNRIVGVVVDVKAIMEGRALQNDFQLKNNDIVFVPKTRIRAIGDVVEELDRVVRPPVDLILRTIQISILRDQFVLLR